MPDHISVTFLGTAAGKPSLTRNVSSLVVKMDSRLWVFDAGEGTQHQLMDPRCTLQMSKINKIFVTHLHGARSFPFPFPSRSLPLILPEQRLTKCFRRRPYQRLTWTAVYDQRRRGERPARSRRSEDRGSEGNCAFLPFHPHLDPVELITHSTLSSTAANTALRSSRSPTIPPHHPQPHLLDPHTPLHRP